MRKSPQDSTKSRTHGQTLSSTWDSWTITLLFKDLFTQCLKTCSYQAYTHVWTLFKTCLHYVETHVYTMLLEIMIIPYWKMHLQKWRHFSIILNMFTTFETFLCHVQRHEMSCMKTYWQTGLQKIDDICYNIFESILIKICSNFF